MTASPAVKAAPTQARAIETRRRILAATVSSLVECGYAGTTTYEVCRRAKVQRGTLLYHFRTRADLLTAALEGLVERRMADFSRDAQEIPKDELSIKRVVDLLWEQVQSPAHYAWLELIVASRTDPDLLASVRTMMNRLNAEMERIFGELFPLPDEADAPRTALHAYAPHFTFYLLHGLSLAHIYGRGEHESQTLLAASELGSFLNEPRSHDSEDS